VPRQPLSEASTPKPLRALGDRRGTATHATGVRCAQLVDGLYGRPLGWSLEAAAAELNVSVRSVERYVKACTNFITDPAGRPRIEIVRHGGRRLFRLVPRLPARESTVFQVAALRLARALLRFAGGTVLEQLLDDACERLEAVARPEDRERLAGLERKFYAIPFVEKHYRHLDDTVDRILRGLIEQRRLRIDYDGTRGAGRVHAFDPYTLAVYRGGLYLIGRSDRYEKIIYLAVERIRSIELGQERFEYPARYSPHRHHRGVFGIIGGEETRVELLLRDPETTALLRARRLNLGERFHPRKDGMALLTMRVGGIDELTNWVLGFGPHVQVLRPARFGSGWRVTCGLPVRCTRRHDDRRRRVPRAPCPPGDGLGPAHVSPEHLRRAGLRGSVRDVALFAAGASRCRCGS
jgi:predicted DNA-binding transcriptional regulator YafY